VDKFLSLSEIYSKSPETLIRAYRPQRGLTLLTDPLGGPNLTHVITEGRLGDRAMQLLPDDFGSAPIPAATTLIRSAATIERNRYRRVIVGTSDLTLSPLIRPGAILKIDTHKRAIATDDALSDREAATWINSPLIQRESSDARNTAGRAT
jgi:hypothetical protein